MKKAALLFVFTPLFWTILTKPALFFSEWAAIPKYTQAKVSTIFSSEKVEKINTMRSVSNRRILYNKATIIADEFFSAASVLSPRKYFQAGGSTSLSPKKVEPIAGFTFVFWVLGILKAAKRQMWKPFLFMFFLALLVQFFAAPTFAFLLPVSLVYLFFVVLGVEDLKYKNKVYAAIILYQLFLITRMFAI